MRIFYAAILLIASTGFILAGGQTHTFPALDTNNTFTGTNAFTTVTAATGSQGTPSYGFTGEAGQGMYYNTGVNSIVLTDGGVDSLGIQTSVVMLSQSGGLAFFGQTGGVFSGTRDTGLSRPAAGTVCVDTTAVGICKGFLESAGLIASGTAATLTGTGACATVTTQTGGAWAGSAKCTGATAASTLTITPGNTAPNGWICNVQDETTRANLFQQTSHTTAACVLTITSVTQNDVFVFSAIAY